MAQDWWRLGIADLAVQLRSGALDAETLADLVLARIAAIDPALNTMVVVDAEGARAQARDSATRLKAGRALSPLDGIPITIKDNLLVRGLPATWGSRGYATYVPDHDELPVARLRAGGRRHHRQDECSRADARGLYVEPTVRPDAQPVGRAADTGRIERRRRGRRGRRAGAGGDRHRWRRLDPASRVPHRADRLQAHPSAVTRARMDFPSFCPISKS